MAQSHRIPAGSAFLPGEIIVPPGACGLVLFAHGSGSSRHSPRNRAVAAKLADAGIGTGLFDLLTEAEGEIDAVTGDYRFDVQLLGERLTAITDWLAEQDSTAGLATGLYGASTGAAAALIAAAARPRAVQAVVSRGGRPDLAEDVLSQIHQPTLLIVGERDPAVLTLNRVALAKLTGPARLEVVPNATHLFGEPGAMERVTELAGDWFVRYLRR
ncbi:MAG TPA: alpha/beta family hydrolase [Jatrophihabitans sp.]|nr:alpha/beta family hydrolase [Jatrophihabitans sp.]